MNTSNTRCFDNTYMYKYSKLLLKAIYLFIYLFIHLFILFVLFMCRNVKGTFDKAVE